MVSVNPIMVDGTGMCGGCRVKVGGEVRFGCVDGPDFDGHLVDFDDLMARLHRFDTQERTAQARWSESCRMPEPAQEAAQPQARAAAPDTCELPDPAEEVFGG
jgi:hypothetical protein